MGRQLQLATTRGDEAELLRFIASLGPIRVFQSHAPKQDALWISEYEQVGAPPWTLYIWPQAFPWTPTYKQTGGPGCPPESVGRFYIANSSFAPILELSRSDLQRQRFGRIYWGSDFSAPQGLDYDVAAFSQLTDSVWRWIRKVGERASSSTRSIYYLPEASKLRGASRA